MTSDSVVQSCQSFVVTRRTEKESRIRTDVERVTRQTVKKLCTFPLTFEVAHRGAGKNGYDNHRRRGPTEPESTVLLAIVGGIVNDWQLGKHRGRQQLAKFGFTVIRSSIISAAETATVPKRKPMTSPIAQNFRRLGKLGFMGKLGGSMIRKRSPCCSNSMLVAIAESFFFLSKSS